MDAKQFGESIDTRFERDIQTAKESIENAFKDRDDMRYLLECGYLTPILEYVNFVGSGRWLHVTVPLDKKLFSDIVRDLQTIGWKSDEVSVRDGSASCNLQLKLESFNRPKDIYISLNAWGARVGTHCRIVELRPRQEYDPGVYEWVCEEGYQEVMKEKVDA